MPGSAHGYNVIDHNQINPELGGEDGFRTLARLAKQHGLGWIQDIVPNHMAYSPLNPLLFDLFEQGEASRYWSYFDIDWESPYPGLEGRVIAPFLGSLYGEVLERGEISLSYGEDGFRLSCYQMHFPLRVESYRTVLELRLQELERQLGRDDPDMLKLLGVLYTLEGLDREQEWETRLDKTGFIKRMLWELYRDVPAMRRYLDTTVAEFNTGGGGGYDLLNELHWQQVYRLSYWKVAGEEINYRRFFSVNDLICLRVEKQEVFDHSHQLLFSLVEEGLIDGVRVDHIDGLHEPGDYQLRLRERLGERPLFVEKILHDGEQMPDHWVCDGTTGYESLVAVDRLFADPRGVERLQRHYRGFAGIRESVEALLARAKRRFIADHMSGDIENLVRYIKRLLSTDRRAIDITNRSLETALSEVMVHFPVYRSYTTVQLNRDADHGYVKRAVETARAHLPDYGYELDYIEQQLLLSFPDEADEESRTHWSDMVQRFQQFTGPLMAKGLEDTVMYGYAPLLSANEVGGDPEILSSSVRRFHDFAQALSPSTMTTSSTHDTKRGEDTRLRIAMISHLPEQWEQLSRQWRDENRRYKQRVARAPAPDANDEYMIYQLLLALVPAEGRFPDELRERLQRYLEKALREAKRHTSWVQINQAYEQAAGRFLDRVLDQLLDVPESSAGSDTAPGPFVHTSRQLAATVQHYSDSLMHARTVLRMLMPGVPDTYRGSETLDLTLVDPDNRRPVDFGRNAELLESFDAGAADLSTDARKLGRVATLLRLRKRYAALLSSSVYTPLSVEGSGSARVLAFGRGESCELVAVVLLSPVTEPVEVLINGIDAGVSYRGTDASVETVSSSSGTVPVVLSMDDPAAVFERV